MRLIKFSGAKQDVHMQYAPLENLTIHVYATKLNSLSTKDKPITARNTVTQKSTQKITFFAVSR